MSRNSTRKPRKTTRRSQGETREHRMMMRAHRDLMDIVDIRAAERGDSRSRFIERLLVAFVKADPRNPQIDASGRIASMAPKIDAAGDPMRFGAAWAKFGAINAQLFNLTQLPDEWLDARLPVDAEGRLLTKRT